MIMLYVDPLIHGHKVVVHIGVKINNWDQHNLVLYVRVGFESHVTQPNPSFVHLYMLVHQNK